MSSWTAPCFLSLTLGDVTTSQLMYMPPQVTCLFLSGMGQVGECTTMDNKVNNVQGCNRPGHDYKTNS